MSTVAYGALRRLARLPSLTQLWIGATALLVLVLLIDPSLLARGDPYYVSVANRLQPPSLTHPFGTDGAGRDILVRVIYGARISLGTSVAIVTVAAIVGTVYGGAAAWAGGLTGRVMMRVVDLFLAFPYLVLAMAISAALGHGIESSIVALTLLWWPGFARMVHSRVLSVLSDLHIQAARTLAASGWQILRWHVLPHALDQVRVRFALDIGYVLTAVTGLSFLGLGAQPPSPEWGLMVSDAESTVLLAWWYAVFPGLVIFSTVLNFVAIGELLERRSRG